MLKYKVICWGGGEGRTWSTFSVSMMDSLFRGCTALGLGTVHIWTGMVSVPEIRYGTQRYLFLVLYSLCNNKNIYFSEKISPKLNFNMLNNSTQQIFLPEILVLFFLIIKWGHETLIYFNQMKMKPFNFFAQTNRGLQKMKINTW